ncbi:MAG: hypothetical protein IPM07_26945 [Anaerolineales bacterium]|nr:hypothetical protein [Anaerolineales bacterium]
MTTTLSFRVVKLHRRLQQVDVLGERDRPSNREPWCSAPVGFTDLLADLGGLPETSAAVGSWDGSSIE